MLQWKRLAAALTLAGALIAVGCSSDTQSEKMIQSFTRTRETLVNAQNQVDHAMVTLLRLRRTPGQR